MKVLIVGGVAGGAGTAARLRRNDEKAQIIVLERGDFISFANCGLPYYIGGVIKEESNLLLNTPEGFGTRFLVDVRVKNEALSVDTKNKTVAVKDLKDGRVYEESYDKLVLSPGAKPFIMPVKGSDLPHVFTLRNMNDTFRIADYIKKENPKTAAVLGGGYIAVEMAENLHRAGLSVSIVVRSRLIKGLDDDMVAEIHNHIRDQGVNLMLKTNVSEIDENELILENGLKILADLVIMSAGVVPDTGFLKGSGIALGQKGEILVDEHLQTNAEDVYAVGDAISVRNVVSDTKEIITLASPANKQARIVADVMSGKEAAYTGAQGTAIIKVFDMTAAVTGLNEAGLQKNRMAYQKSVIYAASNASYYPGGRMMAVKILFDPETGKLFGGQITGKKGVDKRIDVLATAVHSGLTVFDLQELELAYAPPFSSAKDPVNMAGYVAGNIVEKMSRPIFVDELKDLPEDAFLLDVRTPLEYRAGTIKNAVNIELDRLRENFDALPKDRELIVFCRIGLRGHIAQQILKQNGFKSRNLMGGYLLYEQYALDNPGL